jgi:hypothetical protein
MALSIVSGLFISLQEIQFFCSCPTPFHIPF